MLFTIQALIILYFSLAISRCNISKDVVVGSKQLCVADTSAYFA